jgi:hypothetical protein
MILVTLDIKMSEDTSILWRIVDVLEISQRDRCRAAVTPCKLQDNHMKLIETTL